MFPKYINHTRNVTEEFLHIFNVCRNVKREKFQKGNKWSETTPSFRNRRRYWVSAPFPPSYAYDLGTSWWWVVNFVSRQLCLLWHPSPALMRLTDCQGHFHCAALSERTVRVGLTQQAVHIHVRQIKQHGLCNLLRCNTVYYSRYVLLFWRNLLSPTSGYHKNEQVGQPLPLPGIEPRFLSFPTNSLVNTPTALSRLLVFPN
jgi:hypothetical protein